MKKVEPSRCKSTHGQKFDCTIFFLGFVMLVLICGLFLPGILMRENKPTQPPATDNQTKPVISLNSSTLDLTNLCFSNEDCTQIVNNFHEPDINKVLLHDCCCSFWQARAWGNTCQICPKPETDEFASLCGRTVLLKVSEPWYDTNIGRHQAERKLLLPVNEHGAFLVRNSKTRPGTYYLSVRVEDSVKHYRIHYIAKTGFFIHAPAIFPTLSELVAHYSVDADGLSVNLREPCKTVSDPDYQRSDAL